MTDKNSQRGWRALWSGCAIAVLVLGCGATHDPASAPPEGTGRVAMALQVAPGVTISSADYAITGPNNFRSRGTVAIGDSADVPVTVSGLPAGMGYNLNVMGVASDAVTICSGDATFDVGSDATSTVTVHLTCQQPPHAGTASVVGDINLCPVVDGLAASPSEAFVGASLTLTATAHDNDSGPAALTYTWMANGGILAGISGATPTFTCNAAGTFRVGVSISDGDAACSDNLSVRVVCTAVTP